MKYLQFSFRPVTPAGYILQWEGAEEIPDLEGGFEIQTTEGEEYYENVAQAQSRMNDLIEEYE